ncbi:MAG: TonB-dependent receptor plug domain-containing protein, partial [Pseudomonadota bacterium]
MRKFKEALVRVSVIALAVGFATSAQAQDADSAEDEDVIIVTGSSLRGVAPVGSSLVSIGSEDLENTAIQTVQQALKTVPAVVGLNSPGQGGFGSFDGAGTNAPTIHSLGASASNSTLILLNGHRMPVGGANHVLADPNIVPTIMLQRVEVLADGASSVYGSDAVAGVINFITRRNLDGLEANFQKGFGDSYGTINASAAFGQTWDSGSFIIGYAYSDRDNLSAGDRDFTNPNQVTRGGFNFLDNNCGPAGTLTTGGLAYYAPYNTAGAAYVPAGTTNPIANQNGRCGYVDAWDLIPAETRHNMMASIQQDVGDALRITADLIYSNRQSTQRISRGNANGTVYLSGAPAGQSNNPFATAAFTALNATRAQSSLAPVTSATVNFNGDTLLGEGAQAIGRDETFYGRLDLDYEVVEDVHVNVGGLVGRNDSSVETIGRINASGFQLALNGRAAATINGVSQSVSQTLSAANALDVFGGGQTSAATLATLTDSRVFQLGEQTILNAYAKIEARLFELPGGPARIAVGGEFTQYDLD